MGLNLSLKRRPGTSGEPGGEADGAPADAIAAASQWRLIGLRFRRHKLAMASTAVVLVLVLVGAFCEFVAPTTSGEYSAQHTHAPPQALHFVDTSDGLDLGFYVYGYDSTRNQETLAREYTVDTSDKIPLGFFVEGTPYRMWGLIPADTHLFGPTDPGDRMYLLGADRNGRDMLSRIVYGTRISLSIGLLGVALAFVLGVVLGGASGYFGGRTDNFIQRLIEFTMSIPTIPLWMGLSAAVPREWGSLMTYFAITVILSLIGWTDLARVVRGRFLSLREEDFVLAARLDGCSRPRIIRRHMLPSFTSHIVASLTLAIPLMILAESSLSFLGLGLQPPVVSWGVLMQEAQNIHSIAGAPWTLLPGVAVTVTVLALNFVGDGIRDSADPYQ
ncbi:ABC transporter permease [Streptomonospora litoralis]|uniref:Dipeptide transport system permease protein DppC n=1 Tax=Streptomonospora litoralis TaxID=2498135 RepID=A0A4P6PXU3_9ACTN|nr:ABC transporter permease [Streptomonospora litoralis]QBI53028.1 Dipeptide transport system permease protein DppC [Streptomonospora litoralis]